MQPVALVGLDPPAVAEASLRNTSKRPRVEISPGGAGVRTTGRPESLRREAPAIAGTDRPGGRCAWVGSSLKPQSRRVVHWPGVGSATRSENLSPRVYAPAPGPGNPPNCFAADSR